MIIFLVDNSASLPPLDPEEKRVAALQKMFGFVAGRPYRLVLFGGRGEVSTDDPTRYSSDGQWTDFYFAFLRVRELMKEYPAGTEFQIILLTDAILDPKPADWEDMSLPPGTELKVEAERKTLELVQQMKVPLYVILVGDPTLPGQSVGERDQSPRLVLDLVRAANGPQAAPMAQSLASFFEDDGLLVKRFVYRVRPQEGLKKIEPAVKRIVAPSRPTVELKVFGYLVLPLALFLLLGLGILVRSFPGPGDVEIVELSMGAPVHVAVDRLHRLGEGGWGARGLSLVGHARDASATLVYQAPALDLTGAGLNTDGLDPLSLDLLSLAVEDLRRKLQHYTSEGSKEEKIYALNLEYIAQNLDGREAERILATPVAERRRLEAMDFLRAKTHLLSNEVLRRSLTEPRVQLTTYGREGLRKELPPGAAVPIGPYRFLVKDVARGGRKDVRLVLYYDRIPSLLGLKSWIPDVVQRLFRLRRSSQRVVT